MYGDKLKEIRKALGFSQKELSDVLQISIMALSRLETNGSSLKVELITKIEGLGISLDWLIVNKGEMFREGFAPDEEDEPFDRYGYNLGEDYQNNKLAKNKKRQSDKEIVKINNDNIPTNVEVSREGFAPDEEDKPFDRYGYNLPIHSEDKSLIDMYGARIKEIRSIKGMTQGELAEFLSIPQSNLFRYENNTGQLNADKLQKFYQLGINVNWLLTGQGEMFRDTDSSFPEVSASSSDKEETFSVPIFDIAAAAGEGNINNNDIIIGVFELGEEFRAYWGNDVGFIKIIGDSMEPTIRRNTWVLVKQLSHLKSEGIFIFIHDNELRCKRVFKDFSGNIHIISDNKIYPEEIHSKDSGNLSELIVLGEVVCVMREV